LRTKKEEDQEASDVVIIISLVIIQIIKVKSVGAINQFKCTWKLSMSTLDDTYICLTHRDKVKPGLW